MHSGWALERPRERQPTQHMLSDTMGIRRPHHRFGDRLADGLLGGLLEALEHQRRDLLGRQLPVVDLHARQVSLAGDDAVGELAEVVSAVVDRPSDQALHREHGAVGVLEPEVFGLMAHERAAVWVEADHRRRQRVGALVAQHVRGLPAGAERGDAVGGAEVDADDESRRRRFTIVLRAHDLASRSAKAFWW